MTKKTTLKINTPMGEFTRTTATAYTHVVVAIAASRCGEKFNGPEDCAAHCAPHAWSGGIHARILKDRGYIVSWHSSETNARKAAEKGNSDYFTVRDAQVFAIGEGK